MKRIALLSLSVFTLFLISCTEQHPAVSEAQSSLNEDYNQTVQSLQFSEDAGNVYVYLVSDASLDYESTESLADDVAQSTYDYLSGKITFNQIEVTIERAEMTTGTGTGAAASALSEVFTYDVEEFE